MENGVYRISETRGVVIENGMGYGVNFAHGLYGGRTDRDLWLATKLRKPVPLDEKMTAWLNAATLDPVQEVHFID